MHSINNGTKPYYRLASLFHAWNIFRYSQPIDEKRYFSLDEPNKKKWPRLTFPKFPIPTKLQATTHNRVKSKPTTSPHGIKFYDSGDAPKALTPPTALKPINGILSLNYKSTPNLVAYRQLSYKTPSPLLLTYIADQPPVAPPLSPLSVPQIVVLPYERISPLRSVEEKKISPLPSVEEKKISPVPSDEEKKITPATPALQLPQQEIKAVLDSSSSEEKVAYASFPDKGIILVSITLTDTEIGQLTDDEKNNRKSDAAGHQYAIIDDRLRNREFKVSTPLPRLAALQHFDITPPRVTKNKLIAVCRYEKTGQTDLPYFSDSNNNYTFEILDYSGIKLGESFDNYICVDFCGDYWNRKLKQEREVLTKKSAYKLSNRKRTEQERSCRDHKYKENNLTTAHHKNVRLDMNSHPNDNYDMGFLSDYVVQFNKPDLTQEEEKTIRTNAMLKLEKKIAWLKIYADLDHKQQISKLLNTAKQMKIFNKHRSKYFKFTYVGGCGLSMFSSKTKTIIQIENLAKNNLSKP